MSLDNILLDDLILCLRNNRLGITNHIINSPFNLNDDTYHCSAIVKERKKKQRLLCGFNRSK